MSRDRFSLGVLLGISGAIGLPGMGLTQSVPSNIVPDETLGVERSVVTENYNGLPVEAVFGGAQRGINLFHSFLEFNVGEGRGAYFAVPNDAVQNILMRVTGNNRSEVLGTLGTFRASDRTTGVSGVNLFFINPNGAVFGKNSSLDLGGSFFVTTANALQLGETGLFSASQAESSNLLTVNPSAFLFNQIVTQGEIVNLSQATQTVLGKTTYYGLQVPNGKVLLLLGGDIIVDGGGLNAWEGRIEIASVKGTGAINLTPDGILAIADSVKRGDIQLKNRAYVEVTLNDGGNIGITAQNIEISTGSGLFAGIFQGSNIFTSQAGDISLNASDAVHIDGFSKISNFVYQEASGNAGNILITAGSLTLSNGAVINSNTFGKGNAGNIFLNIKNDTILDGMSSNKQSSAIASQVYIQAVGNGGNLNLTTGTLTLVNGARLSASTFGKGNAGNVNLTVRDAVIFDGIGSNGGASGIGSQVNIGAIGQGGNLTLTAGTLTVTNGAQLSASTLGIGDAGNVNLVVRDATIFDGISNNGVNSSAGSTVEANAIGKGGSLSLITSSLKLTNGAQLSASTFGKGDAGNLNLIVQDTTILDGISSNGFPSGAASLVGEAAIGKGGSLNLTSGSLIVTNGARLLSSTLGRGDAGNVLVSIKDSAIFNGIGIDGFPSGMASQVKQNAIGKGGNLFLSAKSLVITDGAVLNSSTFGQGNAGNIILNVQDITVFDGPTSGAASQVADIAVGKGGNLTITTDSLIINNGAKLSVSTFGQGDAGNIILQIKNKLQAANSEISTFSRQNSGGGINIIAKSIKLFGDTNITTSVLSGTGNSGSITMSSNSILALDDSDILAFARDGQGGNVTLNTPAFFGQNYHPAPFGIAPETLNGNNRVDINASGSVSGVITLPNTNFIQNSLTQLPNNQIDTNQLLAQTCLIRQDQPEGTFYITGTGGISNRPNDPALSAYSTNTIQPTTQITQTPWKLGDPIVEPQGFYKLTNGRLVMSRECTH